MNLWRGNSCFVGKIAPTAGAEGCCWGWLVSLRHLLASWPWTAVATIHTQHEGLSPSYVAAYPSVQPAITDSLPFAWGFLDRDLSVNPLALSLGLGWALSWCLFCMYLLGWWLSLPARHCHQCLSYTFSLRGRSAACKVLGALCRRLGYGFADSFPGKRLPVFSVEDL